MISFIIGVGIGLAIHFAWDKWGRDLFEDYFGG